MVRQAVFGGSYGWSSAGRFHHAQSQVHRFPNTALGGYVRSVNSYSAGASAVILPHILGSMDDVARRNVTWEQIVEYADVVLSFGGMALKNSRVASGGISRHIERVSMARAAARGCRFVSVSPLRGDMPTESRAEWLAIVPGTDTAMMLGMAHVLVTEGLHDRASWRRTATAGMRSRLICWAARTACRRRRRGPPRCAACRPTPSRPWRVRWRAGAC